MGYKFSLVLSREITDDETVVLKQAGCTSTVFGTDSLPTNADVIVAKMDFDDSESPSLADAIEAALEAVKQVHGLTVAGLTVPAQAAGPVTEEEPAKETGGKPDVLVGEVIEEPAAKKPRVRKTASRTAAKNKTVTAVAEPAETG